MAKKKAVSSTKGKSAATRKRSTRAGKAPSLSPNKKTSKRGKAPAGKPEASAPADEKKGISDELIGQTAGEVWHLLSANGGQSLKALRKSIDRPAELVLAAVGWLAREGKLEFTFRGRSLKVSLR